MKHISNKDDWFYEFRPYGIIAFGIAGLLSRSLLGSTAQNYTIVTFLCSFALIGLGSFIVSMRKEYRKSSWMK